MLATFRSVLGSPALRAGDPLVLSGEGRLDSPVRWVHVGEVRQVAGLLQGGELILSTGLAMTGPVHAAVTYLRELVRAGASGLVVELGEALPEVPAEVVAAARAADFPLVALRRTVRFVEITEEVHRGIVAEQLAHVEFARTVHEQFTRLSLEGADAATIVATTASLCGSSVVLEDLTRHVVAFFALGRPAAGLLADWERRSRQAPSVDGTGVAGPEGWVTASVGRHGSRWGRLVLPDPHAAQSRLAMVLERAAQALELGRMVERDRLSLELQAQGGLLEDLAAGRIDEESALARAAALGLTPAPAYVAVVAHPLEADATDPLTQHDRSRDLVERLAKAVRTAGLSGLVGSLSGRQVGVLLAVRTGGQERAKDGDRALGALAATLPERLATLGVGPAAATLSAAGSALRQAKHVAAVAAAMPGESRPFYRGSDIRLFGLMALLHDDPRVQAFVESELAVLLAHETRSGGGLVDLLRQYVAVGGNKTRLAELSHRSRPAVYKKLDKIRRILAVDLEDPASLMSLGVALMAYDLGRR